MQLKYETKSVISEMPSELTMTAQVQTSTDQSKSLTIEKLPIY